VQRGIAHTAQRCAVVNERLMLAIAVAVALLDQQIAAAERHERSASLFTGDAGCRFATIVANRQVQHANSVIGSATRDRGLAAQHKHATRATIIHGAQRFGIGCAEVFTARFARVAKKLFARQLHRGRSAIGLPIKIGIGGAQTYRLRIDALQRRGARRARPTIDDGSRGINYDGWCINASWRIGLVACSDTEKHSGTNNARELHGSPVTRTLRQFHHGTPRPD